MAKSKQEFVVNRREFLLGSTLGMFGLKSQQLSEEARQQSMFGIIGKIVAKTDRRDELASILMEGMSDLPGCLSYIVAKDPHDDDALWVTEVWRSQAKHEESLSLASVRDAIERGRPLIASFAERVETIPIGGKGLAD